MEAVYKQLSVLHGAVGILQIQRAGADGLDLRAEQLDAGLVLILHKIVVEGLAVLRRDLDASLFRIGSPHFAGKWGIYLIVYHDFPVGSSRTLGARGRNLPLFILPPVCYNGQHDICPFFGKTIGEVFCMNNGMELTEKTLSREDLFTGRVVSLHVDTVELPNGATSVREVVEHVDGVAVLPLDGDNNVLTVTQYRYVFRKPMLEIPAGKLDEGEDPRAGALRELREETGAVPETLEHLGNIVLSPGCFGETLHLYLARGLHMGEQHLDEDEFLNVDRVPFHELLERCMSGEIEDAKTVTAVLKTKLLLDI